MEDAWTAQKGHTDLICAEETRSDRQTHLKGHSRRSTSNEPSRKRKKPATGPKTALDDLLDKPCPIHSILLNANPTHILRTYWVVKQVAKGGEARKHEST
jgi:hypothetical protein